MKKLSPEMQRALLCVLKPSGHHISDAWPVNDLMRDCLVTVTTLRALLGRGLIEIRTTDIRSSNVLTKSVLQLFSTVHVTAAGMPHALAAEAARQRKARR